MAKRVPQAGSVSACKGVRISVQGRSDRRPGGSSNAQEGLATVGASYISYRMRLTFAFLLGLGALSFPVAVPSLAATVSQRTFRDATARISFTYPSAWHVTRDAYAPVSDPVPRFVLYSDGSLNTGVLKPRPDQVIAVALEGELPLPLNLSGFPARPTHFAAPRLGRMENFDGNRWGELAFREHGRAFYIFVAVGTSARPQLGQLLRALDSLRIGSR
jgi:hypothetical protein